MFLLAASLFPDLWLGCVFWPKTHQRKTQFSGNNSDVGSSVITNVSFWWGTEVMHIEEQGIISVLYP